MGRVLDRHRGAEDDQQAIALELVDVPAVVEHDVHHLAEVAVEKEDQVLRLHLLGKGGEARDVGGQHRHLEALTGQEVALGIA